MWFIFEPDFAAPNGFGSLLLGSPVLSLSLSFPFALYLFIYLAQTFISAWAEIASVTNI